MSPFPASKIIDSFRQAPLAWSGAALFAALPLAVVALKQPAAPVQPVPPAAQTSTATVASGGGVADWFSGADNPFLTEEQARERRLRAALARVEDVLRRRPDVAAVTVLTSGGAEARSAPAGAVVSIRMQQGVVPLPLVDAAGTLIAAAVPGLKPQEVTVIDETTGIRARATPMDDEQAADGRKALAAAQRATAAAPSPAPVARAIEVEPASAVAWPAWTWVAAGAGALVVAALAFLWRTAGPVEADSAEAAPEDPVVGTLSMALHRGVAEQAPLIATALVERLEQGTGANEVAQLLLGLEPWAAERLLKGMPPEALAKVEEALRDPAGDAPTASVRALAEAVLSVRAAA